MPLPRHLRLCSLLFLIAVSSLCLAEKVSDIHPTNYVTDLAGVLDQQTAARINAVAGDVERKTGAQIAVVTVRSLEGESVEEYAVDLFKHLGVGHKGDRGVLLVLSPPERKYRIEVGYGLEPIINDARAGDIGRAMVPYLRKGDYDSAVALASGSLATLIAKASNVTLDEAPPEVHSKSTDSEDGNLPFIAILILIFGGIGLFALVLWVASKAARSGGGRRGGGNWWMGPGGFGGGWGSGGGWSSGGGGWGGSSGGGIDFGGFGGGSSGGGGASGSW